MPRRSFFSRSPVTIPQRTISADTAIDRPALQAQLDALAEAHNDPRQHILKLLTNTLKTGLMRAQNLFQHGLLGGLETARLIAALHDDIITTLYQFTTTHMSRVSNPTKAERMAICAVGGYGRGEMAPGSDVDLLFLLNDKKGSPHTESVTEYMLYMLWDMGLKVGYATRSLEQNLQAAKDDQTILTALLDLRHLAGDEALTTDMFYRFRKDITKGKGRDYISAKLEERDQRHEREGNSRYVIEPNIKEGKGGLRDLHVLYWIARFLDENGQISDAQNAQSYVDMGLFDQNAATRFVRAADYLWRTRIHLHYAAGRPTENLTFDFQTVLARKMGYASGPVEEAVERFMREYFTNAREVGALTRIACAKLEAEKSIRLPKGLDALLPHSRRNMKEDPNFILDHGRLMFKDPMMLKNRPGQILELFEVAGRRNLDIHPNALSAIDFRRNLIDNNFRRDPDNSLTFQKILLGAKAPYATLKVMNDAGVLGRYLLEFGGIVARTQFNMYHAYTVDEHTLRLVDCVNDIEHGELKDENPIITEIIKGFSERQRLCVYMACLLHDTGKGVGDQCIEGARLARRACRRLGLSQRNTDTISWLVRRHLDMSETAQRRDISDPGTVAEFGDLVGSISRLQMLYALTVVDIKSVGPGVWNDWKGVLLRNLYEATANYLEGKTALEPAAKAKAAREQLFERLPKPLLQKIAPIHKDLPQGYWLTFDMADLVRHARFFGQAMDKQKRHRVHTRLDRPRDITELWVLSDNRPGLFADLTGVIASVGAQIIGARLHTGQSGRVMDVFYLQNSEGLAFGRLNPRLHKRLKDKTQACLDNGSAMDIRLPTMRISRRAAAIPIDPRIDIHDTNDPNISFIEIEGRDRPGLLYDLAHCLHDEALDVLSAHVEVAGARAIDVFYVKGPGLMPKQRETIRQQLLTVLQEPNTEDQTAHKQGQDRHDQASQDTSCD